jgi:hypothetical protein
MEGIRRKGGRQNKKEDRIHMQCDERGKGKREG